jgi:hypothetical protein
MVISLAVLMTAESSPKKREVGYKYWRLTTKLAATRLSAASNK